MATRFGRTGRLADLDQAVGANQEAVDATPVGHPDRAAYLSGLGNVLATRFERTDDAADLDRAVAFAQEAVAASPSESPYLAAQLNDLRQRRFLECRSPKNVRGASQFPIAVRITELQKAATATPILIPTIPEEGARLYVILDIPPRCQVITDAIVPLNLPPRGDSDEAWFVIRAPETNGFYRFGVTVLWGNAEGNALAREPIIVEVSDGPTSPMDITIHPTRTVTADQPSAVLVIARSSGRKYLYVLNRPGHSPVIDELRMNADPRSKLRALTSELNQMVKGGAWRPAGLRDELRARGSDLWRDFLPDEIREVLNDLRPGEDTLSISCTNSTLAVPWEMLYPIDPIAGHLDFLVQLFDVVRSPESTAARCPKFALYPAAIVLPDDQLPGALEEARTINEILGGAQDDTVYIREKVKLQQELRKGSFGLLHFAAHDRDGQGTISLAARQMFGPSDLNEFASSSGKWSSRRPLVFVNACGTATSRQTFTQFTSWAQRSFEAGAGGFIGQGFVKVACAV